MQELELVIQIAEDIMKAYFSITYAALACGCIHRVKSHRSLFFVFRVRKSRSFKNTMGFFSLM